MQDCTGSYGLCEGHFVTSLILLQLLSPVYVTPPALPPVPTTYVALVPVCTGHRRQHPRQPAACAAETAGTA